MNILDQGSDVRPSTRHIVTSLLLLWFFYAIVRSSGTDAYYLRPHNWRITEENGE